jgi:hypothetical protein
MQLAKKNVLSCKAQQPPLVFILARMDWPPTYLIKIKWSLKFFKVSNLYLKLAVIEILEYKSFV